THRTTGDDTGTGGSRAKQHDTGGGLTLHGVRDGGCDAGHAEEVLLRLLDALRDRQRHLARLAVADADHAVAIAHDDERREAEATAALDDLRHAVDGHDALEELALLAVTRTAVVARVALAAAATGLARLLSLLGARGGLHDLTLGDLLGLHVLVLLVLGARGRSGGVAHSSSPPSRAPSAIAATRPAYLLPPRSKTTASMPAFLARSATSSPTFFALA